MDTNTKVGNTTGTFSVPHRWTTLLAHHLHYPRCTSVDYRTLCSLVVTLLITMLLWTTTSVAAVAEPADGQVSGFVQDSVTSETIVGATVLVKGTQKGAYTNKAGFFSISGLQPGSYTLQVSFLGYERGEVPITIEPTGGTSVRIRLRQASIMKEQVTVQAERENEKRQISVSRVNIPMQQVNQMRIGGEADIFRAIQMLPGVLTSSQISSGLFIRGGSPDQNLIQLDGMTVYNPTHLFGFISAFNTDAVKDVELLKGGFPAEYGGRLSAVLNVTQKDGNRDRIEGLVGVGLISSRASLQGPLGNGSWFFGARRTYLDLLLGLIPEDPENPFPSFNFYDVNMKITQNLGDNDKLSVTGFITNDVLGLQQPGLLFSLGVGNQAGSLNWTHIFGNDLFLQTTASASRYSNGFNGNNGGFSFEIQNSIIDYTLKSGLEWYVSDNVTLKTGYEGTIYNFTYDQKSASENDNTGGTAQRRLDLWDNIHAGYVQANVLFADRFSLQTGLRANYWSNSQEFLVDPRIALRYQLSDDVALKASWGVFHQYLRLASSPDFSFFDTWLPTDGTVAPGRATHYIVAVETQPFEGYTFNVDLYYKKLNNINELQNNQTPASRVSDIFFIGDGEAYGAELFLQKKIGRLSGWVGYALGWVFATFDSVNRGATFRPKYDRRHDFKVTALYTLSDHWEIGASFMFQSGQSYTGATSQLGARMPGWEGNIVMVNPSQRWGLRLPNSHQLNLNINYNTQVWDLPFRIFLDVYNVYSRRDIWFRFYDTTGPLPEVTDVRLLPILPTISVELKF